ncbi:MAG TPA: squalene--hopene cyclase [Planctomycetaceae bacterium]|nr:squalene--hopene cyclase [Planctomycetaceae bacterium]
MSLKSFCPAAAKLAQLGCPRMFGAFFAAVILLAGTSDRLAAQPPGGRVGEVVPRDVREMYDRGLSYLATTQREDGGWPNSMQEGPGTVGMGLMVFLASGEDPNFGLYSVHVRRALRNIIAGQDAETGYLGQSMYHHGFGMLALAEAYGTVDDRTLWPSGKNVRSIGASLELAVRCAITSQKNNSQGAWRYSPDSTDADTSVSGAVLVGLLAARNAGIEIPDQAIDKAISFYRQMTSPSGQVAYAGLGGFDESMARVSIATLVYSVARRKDLSEYKSTLGFLKDRIDGGPDQGRGYEDYTRYYQAQALFQGDVEAWERWNKLLVRKLKQAQQRDGSIEGQFGQTTSTSFSLLALAVNFRFLPIYER